MKTVALGLIQLCVAIIFLVATFETSLGKEINSTDDLKKEETHGYDAPWQYDEDSGSQSKSLSSSSSKSHGEGTGSGKGYGGSVRKEKDSDDHGSGHHQKAHVFNVGGPGTTTYAQNYGGGSPYSPTGQHGGGVGHGKGYGGGKQGSGYSSSPYDSSAEGQPHDGPGYNSQSYSSGGGQGGYSPGGGQGGYSSGGGQGGYSPSHRYRKPSTSGYSGYQNYGGAPASSENPGYSSKMQSSYRKPQFQAQNSEHKNTEVQEKINEHLSVFIRQLGNLPQPRFQEGGSEKRNGDREGFLLLPVLPNDKQHKTDEGSQEQEYQHKSGIVEERQTGPDAYNSEEQGKDLGGSYGGYGLGSMPSFDDIKQQNYPDAYPQQEYGGSTGHTSSVAQYGGEARSKKYLLTYDKNSAPIGNSYERIQKQPTFYPGIPNEGYNTGASQKINPYEQKLYREAGGYKMGQQEKYIKDARPTKNDFYGGGKMFELNNNGQKILVVPERAGPAEYGQTYGAGQYPSIGGETSSNKPGGDYGIQYPVAPNRNLLEQNLNRPGAYQNQITIQNLKVKNPNALFRQGKMVENQYEQQHIPDIGFDIGGGGHFGSPLGNFENPKQVINHGGLGGVSVMYKSGGAHGFEGLGGGLHLNPNFIGGNFGMGQPMAYHQGGNLFAKELAAQLRQMGGTQPLYNRPSQKTKSIALFLNKPNQFNNPGQFGPILGGGLPNQFKAPVMNFRPSEIDAKYANQMLPFDMYPGFHGLGSSLNPIISTELMDMY